MDKSIDNLLIHKKDIKGYVIVIPENPNATSESGGVEVADIIKTQRGTNFFHSLAWDVSLYNNSNVRMMSSGEVNKGAFEVLIPCTPAAQD